MRSAIASISCSHILVVASTLCLAWSPPPIERADRQQATKTLNRLSELVKPKASEDGFPWALAHGLLAFGKDFQTDTGRPAITAIMDHLHSRVTDGRIIHYFPAQTPAGLAVEPHPNLILATFMQIGVDPRAVVRASSTSSVSVNRLISDAEWLFSPPKTILQWFNYPWSASLFFSTKPAHQYIRTRRKNIPLHELAKQGLQRLGQEQAFLSELMDRNAPHLVQKQRRGIYRHACGGLHFIQAGLRASALLGDNASLQQARRQLDILKFRWYAERALYRHALRQNPSFQTLILIQELKFFGHILETLVVAKHQGLARLAPETTEFYYEVAADLAHTVHELAPVYASLPSLRKNQPRLYNDLIGDGCHAIKALKDGLQLFYAPSPPPRRTR